MSRPTFKSAYALPPTKTGVRLLDHLVFISYIREELCTKEVMQNEFAVIDTATMQKAYFERPLGFMDDNITQIITQTFGETARQISGNIWLV